MFGLISGLCILSVPLVCGSVLVPVPNCLDYCGFVVQFKVGNQDYPCFILPSQDCFGYLGLLWFHMHFRTICSSSLKNAVEILIGFPLNL